MPTNEEILEDHKEDEGDEGYRGTGKYKPWAVRFMLDEARSDTAKQVDIILEKLEERADFFYKNATDLANKNYERGLFDGIHTARYKIKETLKTSD